MPRGRRPEEVLFCLLFALAGLAGFAEPREGAPGAPGRADLERGREVYGANCVTCHGVRGEGDGKVAEQLRSRTQNFRTGRFKFRSTPSGALPLDEDLFRTISRGVPWTGMTPQSHLDEVDRWAVVGYIKTLSPRFRTERQGLPVAIPPAPDPASGSAALGRKMYGEAKCANCHGEGGKGDGPSSTELKDDWGNPILPSYLNLTRYPRRSGPTPRDLYRTIATGMDGTPMPSYADALTSQEIWAIVAYLDSLPPETDWSGLPDGKGAELVRWRCTICHYMDAPSLGQDRTGWTETVDKMIRWGAPLRAEDREAVIQYFVDHFGRTHSR